MLLRALAVASAATALIPHTAQARTIYQDQGPAELPPASFKGNQFVDSSGCIFMRAGFGSTTTWVPRVTRDRRVMCGFQPTFAASQTRPNPVQSVSTAMPLAKPKVAAAAPAPVPAPKPSAAPMPTIASNMAPAAPAASGGSAKVFTAQTSSAPGGTPVGALPGYDVMATGGAAAPAAPAAPSGPTVNGKAVTLVSMGDCPGYKPVVSKVYTLSDGRTALRCGPGNDYMVVRLARDVQAPDRTASVSGSRNVPAALPVPASMPQTSGPVSGVPFEQTANAGPVVPKGYKMAWTDGRLNPNRGPRTAAGDAAMDLVWTRTVPRRLVNTASMKVVTDQYPGLTYPNTANPPVPTRVAAASRVQPLRVVRAAPKMTATLSTSNAVQSAAPAPRRTKGAGGRYIQIASFGVSGNAARTVRQLQAMGLPVAVAKVRIKGQVMQSVMAGPFASQSQLNAALQGAKRAGFGDAYIR